MFRNQKQAFGTRIQFKWMNDMDGFVQIYWIETVNINPLCFRITIGRLLWFIALFAKSI